MLTLTNRKKIYFFLTIIAIFLFIIAIFLFLMPEKNKPALYTPFQTHETFRVGTIFFINPEERYMIVEINNHYPTLENLKIKIIFNKKTRVMQNTPYFKNDVLVSKDTKDATLSDIHTGDSVEVLYGVQDSNFIAKVIVINAL